MTQTDQNQQVETAPKKEPSKPKQTLSDILLGTVFCILADTLFATSYFFVRLLTKHEIHGDWIMCFKELITTAFALPIFLFLWARGRCVPPPLKIALLILVAAVFCELIGVRFHISAFANIGIVLGNPFIRTFTILSTAFIGALFLREKLTMLKAVTMAVLISAVFVLAFSQTAPKAEAVAAEAAEALVVAENIATPTTISIAGIEFSRIFLIGFLFTFVTGLSYAIYSVLLRFVLRKAAAESKGAPTAEPVPIFFVVSTVCGFGALCGGVFLFKDRGWNGFVDVPPLAWYYVGIAGGLNVFAFYFKNISFRYATATKVATFSVLQIFVSTILGILILQEPTNTLLWAGLSLSVLGIILASRTS